MKPYSGQVTVPPNSMTAEIDISPPAGYQWLVYQISVSNTGTSSSDVSVYLNQRFVCGSSAGNQDSADGSPVPVRSGDSLRAVWSAATAGSVCNLQILVTEWLMGMPQPPTA